MNQPSGWFYTTDKLRELCDVWDKHGSGLTNMRRRAERRGGTLDVGSRLPRGTTVTWSVPNT